MIDNTCKIVGPRELEPCKGVQLWRYYFDCHIISPPLLADFEVNMREVEMA
jgi:hypothetical protein